MTQEKPKIRTLESRGNWKLRLQTIGSEKTYVLEGVADNKKVIDYPVLVRHGQTDWVTYKYPPAIPYVIKKWVYEVLKRRQVRGVL